MLLCLATGACLCRCRCLHDQRMEHSREVTHEARACSLMRRPAYVVPLLRLPAFLPAACAGPGAGGRPGGATAGAAAAGGRGLQRCALRSQEGRLRVPGGCSTSVGATAGASAAGSGHAEGLHCLESCSMWGWLGQGPSATAVSPPTPLPAHHTTGAAPYFILLCRRTANRACRAPCRSWRRRRCGAGGAATGGAVGAAGAAGQRGSAAAAAAAGCGAQPGSRVRGSRVLQPALGGRPELPHRRGNAAGTARAAPAVAGDASSWLLLLFGGAGAQLAAAHARAAR